MILYSSWYLFYIKKFKIFNSLVLFFHIYSQKIFYPLPPPKIMASSLSFGFPNLWPQVGLMGFFNFFCFFVFLSNKMRRHIEFNIIKTKYADSIIYTMCVLNNNIASTLKIKWCYAKRVASGTAEKENQNV